MNKRSPRLDGKMMLDFDTGETVYVEPNEEQQAAAVRRLAWKRREQALKRIRAALPLARQDALAKASRLIYAGKSFPIHLDVVVTCDGYSQTERYSIHDSALMERLLRAGHAVGGWRGMTYRSGRLKSIEPDCLHRVELT